MDALAAPHREAEERSVPPGRPPTPPRRRGTTLTTLVAAAIVAALAAATTTAGLLAWTPLGRTTITQAAPRAPIETRSAGPTTWAAATARAVGPSVARVDVVTPRGRGEGSAVIYRPDGYLLTNNHVLEQATKVTVTLPSGKTYDGTVVGTDPATDIGVVKIEATGLPTPAFASAVPRVGDEVLAIGTPFGLSGTVTEGIISATGRTFDTPNAPLTNMLQTDAAINPGNSGGALVNSSGQVVGINTAILSPSGTNNGIGFAIPITAARSIADELIASGSVAHGYLGIAGQTVDPQIASTYRLGVDHGAVVVQVQPGSPAAGAAVQKGDIITAIDGHTVTTMEELSGALVAHQPGDRITMTVFRDGRRMQIVVALGERPTTPGRPQTTPGLP